MASAVFRTDLGGLILGDCLTTLRKVPDDTFDLVIASPPYDRQPRYGNGEAYGRDWYQEPRLARRSSTRS